MVTKVRMIIYLCAAHWTFIATSIAQPDTLTCRSSHLDQGKPTVFLTYIKKERVVSSNKTLREQLLFKLTNNSPCNIQLETPDVVFLSSYEIVRDDKGKPVRLKRRETDVFQPSFLLDGVKYSVICHYEDKKGVGFQVNNLSGCLVYTSLLKSKEYDVVYIFTHSILNIFYNCLLCISFIKSRVK